MGKSLDLFVDDGSIASPYLSRSFLEEIIFGFYIKHSEFLDEAEQKIIAPNPLGEIYIEKEKISDEKIIKITDSFLKHLRNKNNILLYDDLSCSTKVADRERCPKILLSALQKTEKYLKENAAVLPLVHTVYKDNLQQEEITSIFINETEAFLEGNLYYYDEYEKIRNKISVKSYYDDFGKIDFFVEATPEIKIGEQIFYTETITKSAQFSSEFQECYDFLNKVIAKNQKVLWEFSG